MSQTDSPCPYFCNPGRGFVRGRNTSRHFGSVSGGLSDDTGFISHVVIHTRRRVGWLSRLLSSPTRVVFGPYVLVKPFWLGFVLCQSPCPPYTRTQVTTLSFPTSRSVHSLLPQSHRPKLFIPVQPHPRTPLLSPYGFVSTSGILTVLCALFVSHL